MLPNLGFFEMAVILGIGLLLFGRNLPQVGRSLGKTFVEFKKGLRGIEDEMDEAVNRPSSTRPSASDRLDVDAPKFEIPEIRSK